MVSELNSIVSQGFIARYTELSQSVAKLASSLSEDQFWQKPFSFGNSFGHLVLHLAGNLNYYIGAEIAATGYIRDRPREFTEPTRIPKEVALKKFQAAVDVVLGALRAQAEEDWARSYTAKGEDDASNRFNIFLRCATHLHHHVGEMTYLCFKLVGNKATGL